MHANPHPIYQKPARGPSVEGAELLETFQCKENDAKRTGTERNALARETGVTPLSPAMPAPSQADLFALLPHRAPPRDLIDLNIIQPPVQAIPGHQFLVCALLKDPLALQDDDFIRAADGG